MKFVDVSRNFFRSDASYKEVIRLLVLQSTYDSNSHVCSIAISPSLVLTRETNDSDMTAAAIRYTPAHIH